MAFVEFGKYKENEMIILRRSEQDRFPFQFGMSKAKLILDAYEDIKKWVELQEKNKPKAAAEE